MVLVVGLALLGLTLYMSSLAYTLRDYSRTRLGEHLPEATRTRWLDWLEQHANELPVLAGVVRVTANLSVLVCVWEWYFDADMAPRPNQQAWVPGLIALSLLIVFAIGIPHALALHAGEAILARSLRVLQGLRFVLWPVARTLAGIEFVVRRLLGKTDPQQQQVEWIEQEVLDAVTEGELHGAVDEEQKEMIRSVFELQDTTVIAIMTPRTEIMAIPADAGLEQVQDLVREAGHSRLPVFEQSLDHIVGVLYAKDLIGLRDSTRFNARELMRAVPYVPETKSIYELLTEFRQNKVHIAIVLDEYGGTAGLVTIEDIIEEVVGEIDDEFDRESEPPIKRIDEHTLEVDARVHVYEINEELDTDIPDNGTYETIGGFVFTTLGKIPATGESFQHENLHVQILDAEERKIKRLRISVVPATNAP